MFCISKACRICKNTSDTMEFPFNINSSPGSLFLFLFPDLRHSKINNVLKNLCNPCFEQLLAFEHFKSECIKSDDIFSKYLAQLQGTDRTQGELFCTMKNENEQGGQTNKPNKNRKKKSKKECAVDNNRLKEKKQLDASKDKVDEMDIDIIFNGIHEFNDNENNTATDDNKDVIFEIKDDPEEDDVMNSLDIFVNATSNKNRNTTSKNECADDNNGLKKKQLDVTNDKFIEMDIDLIFDGIYKQEFDGDDNNTANDELDTDNDVIFEIKEDPDANNAIDIVKNEVKTEISLPEDNTNEDEISLHKEGDTVKVEISSDREGDTVTVHEVGDIVALHELGNKVKDEIDDEDERDDFSDIHITKQEREMMDELIASDKTENNDGNNSQALSEDIDKENEHVVKQEELIIEASDSEEVCEEDSEEDLEPLIEEGESITVLICNICNTNFTSQSEIDEHKKTHLNARPRKVYNSIKGFTCLHCGMVITSKTQIIAHKKLHANDKPHKCCECGKVFLRIITMSMHYREHPDVARYACRQCGNIFLRRADMIKHMIIHGIECDVCFKIFILKRNLAKHKKKHEVQTDIHVCPVCRKAFANERFLAKHTITHPAEPEIQCPKCEKMFFFKEDLRLHSNIHKGKPCHKCQYCERYFLKKNILIRHQNMHKEYKVRMARSKAVK